MEERLTVSTTSRRHYGATFKRPPAPNWHRGLAAVWAELYSTAPVSNAVTALNGKLASSPRLLQVVDGVDDPVRGLVAGRHPVVQPHAAAVPDGALQLRADPVRHGPIGDRPPRRKADIVREGAGGAGAGVVWPARYAPRGSAALMGWPEFGFGIHPMDETKSDIVRWRGDREQGRDWPHELHKGGPLPWSGDTVSPAVRRAYYGEAA